MWIDIKQLPPLPRDTMDGTRLVSPWCTVQTDTNEEIKAYYHVFHGWMVKGEPTGEWKFGYQPINKTVLRWKIL